MGEKGKGEEREGGRREQKILLKNMKTILR